MLGKYIGELGVNVCPPFNIIPIWRIREPGVESEL
jgi:hypothetical protein